MQQVSIKNIPPDAVITTGLEVASVSPLCEACEDALHLTRKTLTDPALEAAVNADVKLACAFTGFLHKKVRVFGLYLPRLVIVKSENC